MAATAAALAPACSDTPTKADSNRANAQLSTGPRTEAGKAISSRNALKHGLFASLAHLPFAEREIFDNIAATVPGALQSENSDIQSAAFSVALLLYRLERVRRLEFATYTERMRAICQAENIPEPSDIFQRGLLEARIFREDAEGPRTLTKLHTHERFFTRELEHAHSVLAGFREAERQSEAELARAARIRTPVASFYETNLASSLSANLPASLDPTPRGAPCPCGSGEKYKRCCGKNAPPVLNLNH